MTVDNAKGSGYFGGLKSFASQQMVSDFTEPVATVNVTTLSHFSHSKFRKSNPLGPGIMRAKCI